jgi:hypothetical protein
MIISGDQPSSYGPYNRSNDNPVNLVDQLPRGERLSFDIQEMDRNWKKARLSVQPWSDDYWPLYKGVLGYRHADASFPSGDWKESKNYVEANTALDIHERGDLDEINDLSPSEKTDLALGHQDLRFTKSNWQEAAPYWRPGEEVETWMGICHGWATAAMMLPRPKYPVDLKSGLDDNINIRFYPSDIKSLASYAWAKAAPSSKFIGGRCNDQNPSMDENGRLTSDRCFDTNPATWHVTVVNQIARADRSFIMDVTYDYEVWNQPVLSYQYDYFNPETNDITDNLSAAVIKIEDYTKDKFKTYRSSDARFIVGINMSVQYLVETSPSQDEYDDESDDGLRSVSYQYDLELDENMQIIGGEWYVNKHPDFLWVHTADQRADARYLRHDRNLTWEQNGQKQQTTRSVIRLLDTLIQRSQNPPASNR